jgi:sulfate adenylyltransferase subunit 1
VSLCVFVAPLHWKALNQPMFMKRKSAFPCSNRNPTKNEEYHDFRGYAGKLYGNNIKVGDAVTVLPSLNQW